MNKKYKLALHIFRRDLRLFDNTALVAALTEAKHVVPIFIFDDRQIFNNPYKSNSAIQFMLQSLKELNLELKKKHAKLYFFKGIAEKIIEELTEKNAIDAIYFNRDYTPFSKKRDNAIQILCKKKGVNVHCFSDALLQEPETVKKKNDKPYTVFTPFFNQAKVFEVRGIKKNNYDNYYTKAIPLEDKTIFSELYNQFKNNSVVVKGGRLEGLSLLKKIRTLSNYKEERNYPALHKTTLLSAHNKFGTISIREFYHAVIKLFGPEHTLINELYWRDFFTHIGFHFPYVFKEAFYRKFNQLKWQKNSTFFKAWCQGNTGFPIVDAGMRELNETGFMHNRLRMITASFLVKDLHVDWRLGEHYFAQQLVDYDPAVNNGNWQWAASTGCDAQPYFRIFNPWLQQKKYDKACTYIKKWVPELCNMPVEVIHNLYKNNKMIKNYSHPIVDHAAQISDTKKMYQNCK